MAYRWMRESLGMKEVYSCLSCAHMILPLRLQDAASCLAAAQEAEMALLSAMQCTGSSAPTAAGGTGASGGHGGVFAPPQAPKLLQRGPCFVELSHFALTGHGLKPPARFAVYCKPTGAGVGLSMNRTAMEHPGTQELPRGPPTNLRTHTQGYLPAFATVPAMQGAAASHILA